MIAQLIAIGTLTVTAYQATPAQTKPECLDNWHCYTSIGDPVIPVGCAVSQDLLTSGVVHYREWLYVEGNGYCFVNDTMNPRHKRSIDLFAWTPEDEKRIKPHKAKVYRQKRVRRTNGKRGIVISAGTSLSDVYSVYPRVTPNVGG